MKKMLPYIIVIVLGMVIGWLCRGYHFREEVKVVESDTVYVYKYKSYSHLDLKGSTYKLDVPVVGVPDIIFIREDSTAVEYRDSIRYITAPREFFYTMTPEVEIWHSGIGSRIDSLNVRVQNSVITNKIVPKEKKHGLSLGVELGYMSALSIPIYLEYERMLQKNVGIYGQMLYDLNARQFGVSAGVHLQLEW